MAPEELNEQTTGSMPKPDGGAHFATTLPGSDATPAEQDAATADQTELLDEQTALLSDEPTTLMPEEQTAPPDDEAAQAETSLLGIDNMPENLDVEPLTTLMPQAQEADDEGEALFALKNLEERRRKKRRQKWLRIGAGALAVAAVAGWFVLRGRLQQPTDVPQAPATATVMRQDFKTTVQGSGALQPASSVVVTPEVDGIIENVYVTEGQTVKVGDTLFTIKNDQMQKAIDDAARSVSSAQRMLSEAYSSRDTIYQAMEEERQAYETASAQAQKDMEAAQAAYDAAYQKIVSWDDQVVAEKQALYDEADQKVTEAQQRLDEANQAVVDAQAAYDEAVAAYEEAKKDPERDPKEVEEKQAAMKACEEALRAAEGNVPIAQETLKKAIDLRDGYPNDAGVLENGAKQALDAAKTKRAEIEPAAQQAANEAYAQVPITPVPAYSEASFLSQIESANSTISSAVEAVTTAQEAYDKAVEDAEKRTVKAPASGTLLSLGAKTGASTSGSASATSSSLAEISDLSKMKVTVSVNEIDISTIKVGQKADVTFSALPDLTLKAEVVSIASVAPGSSEGSFGGGGVVSFPVELIIKKPDARLKPGMTANVTIATQDVKDALVVPATALIEDGGKTYVSVVTDLETYATKQCEVKVGERNSVEAVISDGLAEGDTILLTGGFADEMPMDVEEAG